ncbi:unnamed protein product [Closterium sp. NIES-65]|nr:unnamed protein product [Closterium sp. NIES-65]
MPCSHRAHTATLPAHESWPCAHSLLPPLPARMADAPSQRPHSPRGQQQGQLAGQLDGPQRCQGAPLTAPRVCMHGDGREAALPAADLNRCHEGEYGDGLGLSSLSLLLVSANSPVPPPALPLLSLLSIVYARYQLESGSTGARAEWGVDPFTHLLLSPFSLPSQQHPA